ncbi:hypothetical protein Tco_0917340 [Tanacetum coccineum]
MGLVMMNWLVGFVCMDMEWGINGQCGGYAGMKGVGSVVEVDVSWFVGQVGLFSVSIGGGFKDGQAPPLLRNYYEQNIQSTEIFRQSGGPKMVVGILNDGIEDVSVLNSGFAVVAAAATGNEVIKDSFVELHIHELMVKVMRKHSKGSIPSLYDAIRVLLAADDNRVVASQILLAIE